AFLRGRDYALPVDARDLARDVLRHRMVLSYEALADDVSPDDLLGPVLGAVPLPNIPLRERGAQAGAPPTIPPPVGAPPVGGPQPPGTHLTGTHLTAPHLSGSPWTRPAP
ncbi:MAG: hypothetical protein WCG47_20855, partial [Dermatophilaceae bacterium]